MNILRNVDYSGLQTPILCYNTVAYQWMRFSVCKEKGRTFYYNEVQYGTVCNQRWKQTYR